MGNPNLKRMIRVCLCLLSLLAGWNALSWAYFIDFADGVRPAGMGEAFVSIADDANALLFNPAGLAQLDKITVTGMYSDLYSNLQAGLYTQDYDRLGYNFAALAIPLAPGESGLGLGWTQFSSAFYQENTLALSAGTTLWTPRIFDLGLNLDAGFTIKAMQWSVASNSVTTNPDFYPYSSRSKQGYTADAGVLLSPLPNLHLGASLSNFIPADMGLTVSEYLPQTLLVGVSWLLEWRNAYLDSLQVAAEVSERQDVYTPKLGVETWWWHHAVAVRAGVNSDQFSAGFSYHYLWLTQAMGLELDYAFSYPFYIYDTFGSHRVGITIDWMVSKGAPDHDVSKAMDIARGATDVVKSVSLAKSAAAKVKLAAAQADHAAADGNLEELKAAVEEVQKQAEICRLAAEAARAVANETSKELLPKAEQGTAASQEAAVEMLRAKQAYDQAVLPRQKEENAQSENRDDFLRIPEQHTDRITIGVERRILTDFGDLREIQSRLSVLQTYLERATDFKLEILFLTLPELELAFQQGQVDVVIAYGSGFKKYCPLNCKPEITAQINYKDSQQCCLIVREDSQLDRPEQLKNKRLGYTTSKLLPLVGNYFFPDVKNFSPQFFNGTPIPFTNVQDSLVALQMDDVDAVLEFEYAANIYRTMHMPNGIKVIASSPPIFNIPVLVKPSKSSVKNERIQRLVAAALECHKQPAIKDMLLFFNIDRFVPVDENMRQDYLSH